MSLVGWILQHITLWFGACICTCACMHVLTVSGEWVGAQHSLVGIAIVCASIVHANLYGVHMWTCACACSGPHYVCTQYTWDNIVQAPAGDQIMRYVAGGGVCHYGVSASESESLSYNTSTARADTFFGSGWTSAWLSSSSCCLFWPKGKQLCSWQCWTGQ